MNTSTILNNNELVLDTDSKSIKIGDGEKKYSELEYFFSEEEFSDKIEEQRTRIDDGIKQLNQSVIDVEDGKVSSASTYINESISNSEDYITNVGEELKETLKPTVDEHFEDTYDYLNNTVEDVKLSLVDTLRLKMEEFDTSLENSIEKVYTEIDGFIYNGLEQYIPIPDGKYTIDDLLVFDIMIKSQSEFDTMIANEDWGGVVSVAILCNLTIATTVKIPKTVKHIQGFKGATITSTVAYNKSEFIAMYYEDDVFEDDTSDYLIKDIKILKTGTGGVLKNIPNLSNIWYYSTTYVYTIKAFENCNSIKNSMIYITIGYGNSVAFENCNNMKNLTIRSVNSSNYPVIFNNCEYFNNIHYYTASTCVYYLCKNSKHMKNIYMYSYTTSTTKNIRDSYYIKNIYFDPNSIVYTNSNEIIYNVDGISNMVIGSSTKLGYICDLSKNLSNIYIITPTSNGQYVYFYGMVNSQNLSNVFYSKMSGARYQVSSYNKSENIKNSYIEITSLYYSWQYMTGYPIISCNHVTNHTVYMKLSDNCYYVKALSYCNYVNNVQLFWNTDNNQYSSNTAYITVYYCNFVNNFTYGHKDHNNTFNSSNYNDIYISACSFMNNALFYGTKSGSGTNYKYSSSHYLSNVNFSNYIITGTTNLSVSGTNTHLNTETIT